MKENKKCKVPLAKVNKGVKKRARVEAEDPALEGDDIEVNSEDEYAVVRVCTVCDVLVVLAMI